MRCERFYKKARGSEIKGYTGIDSPYEAPKNPELVVVTELLSPDDSIELVMDMLRTRGKLSYP